MKATTAAKDEWETRHTKNGNKHKSVSKKERASKCCGILTDFDVREAVEQASIPSRHCEVVWSGCGCWARWMNENKEQSVDDDKVTLIDDTPHCAPKLVQFTPHVLFVTSRKISSVANQLIKQTRKAFWEKATTFSDVDSAGNVCCTIFCEYLSVAKICRHSHIWTSTPARKQPTSTESRTCLAEAKTRMS